MRICACFDLISGSEGTRPRKIPRRREFFDAAVMVRSRGWRYGALDPRYAEMSIISCSVSCAAIGFISSVVGPERAPL